MDNNLITVSVLCQICVHYKSNTCSGLNEKEYTIAKCEEKEKEIRKEIKKRIKKNI